MATEIPLAGKQTPAEHRRTGPLLIAQWKRQGGGDVKVQVEAMKRKGKAEHLKQRDTEVIPQFSSTQKRDQAESSPNQLTLYAIACLLGAKLSLLFKSLGRKWHRVQSFLKAQFRGERQKQQEKH